MYTSLASRFRVLGFRLPALGSLRPGRDPVLFGVLVAVALGLRLWDLGGRPVHYDESLHAFYSWQLFAGDGYRHEPWTHGPLQFFLNSAVFAIFWDDDFTVRITYALFGAGLVGLPYFLRGYLGQWAALIASAMLALSPALLYFSRYSRNDIYMAFWALALFVLMWRYLHERKDRYLYLSAAVLALAFATKETAYIIVALFGLFLFALVMANLMPFMRSRVCSSQGKAAAVFLLLMATLTLPLWAALLSIFQGSSTEGVVLAYYDDPAIFPVGLPLWSQPFVSLGLVNLHIALDALVLGGMVTAGLGLAVIARGRGKYVFLVLLATALVTLTYALLAMASVEVARSYLIALAVLVGVTVLSAVVGLMWRWRVWLISAAIFYLIWTAFYTSFYGLLVRPYTECPDSLQGVVGPLCTNLGGAFTGVWQSLGYWLAQQDFARGNQPWYYYFVIGSIYEFLPLLLGVVGVVYYLRKGGLLGLFLVFWSVATFIAYTIAGEKMPWLLVNITLPFIILSAKLLGDLLVRLPWRQIRSSVNVTLLLAAPLLLVAGVYLLQRFLDAGRVETSLGWLAVAAVAVLGVVLVILMYRSRLATGLSLAVLGMAALLLGFSAFVGFRATYNSDDGPVEMLVYAGASADVRQLAADLRQELQHADPFQGAQVDYEIWYPLNWYVRRDSFVEYRCYKDETEENYEDWCSPLEEPPSATALVLLDSHGRRDAEHLASYEREGPFKNLLWFPESYRRKGENRQQESFWQEVRKDFGYLQDNIDDRESWRGTWDYLIHRRIGGDWWASRFFIYLSESS